MGLSQSNQSRNFDPNKIYSDGEINLNIQNAFTKYKLEGGTNDGADSPVGSLGWNNATIPQVVPNTVSAEPQPYLPVSPNPQGVNLPNYGLNFGLSEDSLSAINDLKIIQQGGKKRNQNGGSRRNRYSKEQQALNNYIKNLEKKQSGGNLFSDEFNELQKVGQKMKGGFGLLDNSLGTSPSTNTSNKPMNILDVLKMTGGNIDDDEFMDDDDNFLDLDDDLDDLPDLDDDDDDLPDLDEDEDEYYNDNDKKALRRALSSNSEYSMNGGAFSVTSDSGSNMDFVPFSGSDNGTSEVVPNSRNRF